jgi:hypothetical protein
MDKTGFELHSAGCKPVPGRSCLFNDSWVHTLSQPGVKKTKGKAVSPRLFSPYQMAKKLAAQAHGFMPELHSFE